MDPNYGRYYRELYRRHWWWRAREKAVLEVLSRYRPPDGSIAILDVGCGDGLFFDRLKAFGTVEGVESSTAIVDPDGPYARQIYIGRFERFAPDRQYDVVLMLDVLEHLDNPVSALVHALSMLREDGLMVITVPAFDLLWTSHDVINQHRVRYTAGTFRTLAADAGLKIDRQEYWFQWLILPKLAQSLWEKLFHAEPKLPTIPPRLLNLFLYWASRAESKLLWPWAPVGTSLMVTGTRYSACPAQNPDAHAHWKLKPPSSPVHVNHLPDKEKPGHLVGFHGLRREFVGIHAAGGDLSFLVAFGAFRGDLPVVNPVFKFIDRAIGPLCRRVQIEPAVGEAAWHEGAQGCLRSRQVPAGPLPSQRRGHGLFRSEVDRDGRPSFQ